MRKKSSIFTLLLTLVVILCSGLPAWGIDYEITKVVEIGPADEGFMSWPLRWSPDGKWLAYFHNGYLTLSDTLGNSHQAKKIDFFPRRYEWISNEEIVGYFDEGYASDSAWQKIIRIDIETGADTVLEQYMRYKYYHDLTGTTAFHGPWRTVGGNVYYDFYKYQGSFIKSGYIEEKRWALSAKGRKLTDNDKKLDRVLRWGKDGLYKVALDNSDSARIAPRPKVLRTGGLFPSPDETHVFVDGLIIRIQDSAFIFLDTMLGVVPENARFCGSFSPSFCPIRSELIFQISCDSIGGERIISDRIGIFDYDSIELQVLDPIANAKHITNPVFNPDGKKAAFLADCKTYIIYLGLSREGK